MRQCSGACDETRGRGRKATRSKGHAVIRNRCCSHGRGVAEHAYGCDTVVLQHESRGAPCSLGIRRAPQGGAHTPSRWLRTRAEGRPETTTVREGRTHPTGSRRKPVARGSSAHDASSRARSLGQRTLTGRHTHTRTRAHTRARLAYAHTRIRVDARPRLCIYSHAFFHACHAQLCAYAAPDHDSCRRLGVRVAPTRLLYADAAPIPFAARRSPPPRPCTNT